MTSVEQSSTAHEHYLALQRLQAARMLINLRSNYPAELSPDEPFYAQTPFAEAIMYLSKETDGVIQEQSTRNENSNVAIARGVSTVATNLSGLWHDERIQEAFVAKNKVPHQLVGINDVRLYEEGYQVHVEERLRSMPYVERGDFAKALFGSDGGTRNNLAARIAV